MGHLTRLHCRHRRSLQLNEVLLPTRRVRSMIVVRQRQLRLSRRRNVELRLRGLGRVHRSVPLGDWLG